MKLIDFIVNYIDMFTVAFFFDSIFTKNTRKTNPFKYWMILIGSYSLVICVESIKELEPYQAFILLVLTLALSFLYQVKTLWRIIIVLLYQVFAMLSEVFSYGLFDWVVAQGRIYRDYNEADQSTMLFLAKIITLILIILVGFVKQKERESGIPGWQYQIILLFIAVLSICAILCQVGVSGANLIEGSVYPIYLTALVLLIINLLVYKLIDYIVDSTREKHEREKLELLMGMQQIKYNEISAHFVQTNRMIHDTNKHMRYVAYCINNREYEKANQYIADWEERLRDQYKRIDTGNLAVDAMLSSCMQHADEANIRIETDIQIMQDQINIENYDICVVLGNLLDNAMEEVRKIPSQDRRYIKIHSYTNECGIIFEIINPLREGEIPDFSRTSKQNKFRHGYGMKNIQKILEEYGGTIKIVTERGCITVLVYIPFRRESN